MKQQKVNNQQFTCLSFSKEKIKPLEWTGIYQPKQTRYSPLKRVLTVEEKVHQEWDPQKSLIYWS